MNGVSHRYDKYLDIKTQFGDNLRVICCPKDMIENTVYLSGDGLLSRIIAKDILYQIPRYLSDREHEILYFHYVRKYKLKLISNLIGISEQRVWQIHKEIIQGIRRRWLRV